MNNIINKSSLAGGNFMPEMHLRQFGFAYSACGPFIKKNKNIKIERNKILQVYPLE